jgi:hypothetical protein
VLPPVAALQASALLMAEQGAGAQAAGHPGDGSGAVG